MKIRFFRIPVLDEGTLEDELNKFLASHRITHVDKEFVSNGNYSFWSICVTHIDGSSAFPQMRQKSKVDYREVLNEKDFAVYVKLRNLRKELAEKEGIPAYAIFTNEQLAAMVNQRVNMKSGMLAIDGVGESRCNKYGQSFLTLLNEEFSKNQKEEQNVS